MLIHLNTLKSQFSLFTASVTFGTVTSPAEGLLTSFIA